VQINCEDYWILGRGPSVPLNPRVHDEAYLFRVQQLCRLDLKCLRIVNNYVTTRQLAQRVITRVEILYILCSSARPSQKADCRSGD
jgi:hypothetical protein